MSAILSNTTTVDPNISEYEQEETLESFKALITLIRKARICQKFFYI